MSQFTLTFDNSAASNALRLYVSIVRPDLEQSNISIQTEETTNTTGAQLTINSSVKLFGASTIAQYIDRQLTSSVSGPSLVSRPTAIENCQLSQLISLCHRDLSVKVDSATHLDYLNKIVLTNTFFVGSSLSLADLFLFTFLYTPVKTNKSFAKYQAILRWFDYLQHSLPINGLFEKVQPLPFNNKPFAFKAIAPVADAQPAKGGATPAPATGGAAAKKGAEEKKAPAAAAATTGGDQKPADISPSILDMRIGRVLSVKKHEQAEKLLIEEIDVGEEKPRTICSGLVGKIAMEDILGKDVLVMCNLKPSNMVGVASNGMVVCSTDKATGAVELVKIPENSYTVGERIVVEGHEGAPAPANQVSKKLSKILPLFSTNDKGEVVFSGTHRFKTQSGAVLFSQYKGAEVK